MVLREKAWGRRSSQPSMEYAFVAMDCGFPHRSGKTAPRSVQQIYSCCERLASSICDAPSSESTGAGDAERRSPLPSRQRRSWKHSRQSHGEDGAFADRKLTGWLRRAADAEAVFAVAEAAPGLNSIHASAAFVALAKAVQKGRFEEAVRTPAGRHRLGTLAARCCTLVPTCGPRVLTNLLWALAYFPQGRQGRGIPEVGLFLQALVREAGRQLQDFNAQDLSNGFWALATIVASSPPW